MTGNLNILSTEKPSLVTVQDNFLEKDYLNHIINTVWQGNFPWGFQRDVARVGEHKEDGYEDHFYFVHRLYENFIPESSFFDELRPVLEQLEVRALIRMRLLLFVNQGKQIIHDKHTDKPYEHKAALLYLNTNNGFTEFDDESRVECVENRVVVFDGSKEHSSSTCTDKKERILLSVNYF